MWISLYSSIVFILSLTAPACSQSPSQGGPKNVSLPITVPPSQFWDGIDGPWSTFEFRIGSPPQTVRLLVSTAGQETWAVLPEACNGTTNFNLCVTSRGQTFNPNSSTSWSRNDYYKLLLEQNLGYTGNGLFGNDTLGVGYLDTDGPSLPNQIIGGYITDAFPLGVFGANPKPTNFTSLEDPQPSFLTSLRMRKLIPSVSFGYTAGAPYRLKKVLGSLTLGGYDSSRFIPNSLSFDFAPDNSRDLVVGVQSITTDHNSSSKAISLLPSGILSYIDSTVPHIWLPQEACLAFEETFGLVYDTNTQLYLVNDTLHGNLVESNPNITFTLGNNVQGGSTIQIRLPYASFDLQALPPLVDNATRYFPLRRAMNESQYTLGRTFLQEAYLTVDWERFNFTVSQCKFDQDMPANIVSIPPNAESAHPLVPANATKDAPRKISSGLRGAQIAGIVVGIVLACILVTLMAAIWCLKRRYQRKYERQESSAAIAVRKYQIRKLSVSSPILKAELESPMGRELPPSTIAEMSGGTPLTSTPSTSTLTLTDEKRLIQGLTPPPQNQHPVFRTSVSGLNRNRQKTAESVFELPASQPEMAELPNSPSATQQALMHPLKIPSPTLSVRSSAYWESFSSTVGAANPDGVISPSTSTDLALSPLSARDSAMIISPMSPVPNSDRFGSIRIAHGQASIPLTLMEEGPRWK